MPTNIINLRFYIGNLIDPKIRDQWLIEKNLSCSINHVYSILLAKYHMIEDHLQKKKPDFPILTLARIINFDRSTNRSTLLNFDRAQHMALEHWFESINDRVWLARLNSLNWICSKTNMKHLFVI